MATYKSKAEIIALAELNIKNNNKLQITPEKHKEVIYAYLDSNFVVEYDPLSTYGTGIIVTYNDVLYQTIAAIDLGEDPISASGKYRGLIGYLANQANLDSIDQNLGTTDSPEFADVNITTLANDTWLGNAQKSILSFANSVIDKLKLIEKTGSAPNNWLQTIADLRAFTDYDNGDDLGVYANFNVYQFDSSSLATDDGDTVVKPNDKTVGQAGRWLVMKQFQERSLDITNFNRNLTGVTTVQQMADAVDNFHLGHILQSNGVDTAIKDYLDFKGFSINATGTAIEVQVLPVYEYSIDGLTSWHGTYSVNDAYRRDSFDGGLTFTPAYYWQPKELKRRLELAPIGFTSIPCLISAVEHEKITIINLISNIDTLKLTRSGFPDINIRVGGVNQPIDVPIGDYSFNITYSIGFSSGKILLTTELA